MCLVHEAGPQGTILGVNYRRYFLCKAIRHSESTSDELLAGPSIHATFRQRQGLAGQGIDERI